MIGAVLINLNPTYQTHDAGFVIDQADITICLSMTGSSLPTTRRCRLSLSAGSRPRIATIPFSVTRILTSVTWSAYGTHRPSVGFCRGRSFVSKGEQFPTQTLLQVRRVSLPTSQSTSSSPPAPLKEPCCLTATS